MISSFRDGPKDQTRNLELPGSMLRIVPERQTDNTKPRKKIARLFVSEVRRDALVFPIAVARRLRSFRTVKFLRQRRGIGGRLTARLRFGQRTLRRRRQRLPFWTWFGFVTH